VAVAARHRHGHGHDESVDLKLMGRFGHLKPDHVAKMQTFVDAKLKAPGIPVGIPIPPPRAQA
jgi:hypothetical protein